MLLICVTDPFASTAYVAAEPSQQLASSTTDSLDFDSQVQTIIDGMKDNCAQQ
jgi:hypothetical protein